MEKNNSTSEALISSPCISNCCLDDKDICLGCFRHIDEITGWHSASNTEKQTILDKTAIRKGQKASPFD